MAQSELVVKARAGLNAYRERLLELHDGSKSQFVDDIRERVNDMGLVTDAPLVVLPYIPETLQAASALKEQHPWTDPFATEYIDDALSKRQRLDNGDHIYHVGFPEPFCSFLLGVAVVFDDTEVLSDYFGDTYARGYLVHRASHELAHSAFLGITENHYFQIGDTQVKIHEKLGIGQAGRTTTLSRGHAEVLGYHPIWIDEAVAQRAATEVRGDMCSEDALTRSIVENFARYDARNIHVPAKYLIHSDQYPDVPTALASVEGIGMDRLCKDLPWLWSQIQELSAGTLAVKDFHHTLREAVGVELYTAMTKRRSYRTWGEVLRQIERLKDAQSNGAV